ncbi:MAG TPA: hypothetical protein VGS07_09490 [Thermoanaerobaculia bacterium]|nr:hypothetical protein [Thermoanaerobaculia bacterium]
MAEPADSDEVAQLKARIAALEAQVQGSGALTQGNGKVVAREKADRSERCRLPG